MGLLLSVLAVCVGVVELLAFYTNVFQRTTAVAHRSNNQIGFDAITQGYFRDLNRERLRLLAELGEEDLRPDLHAAASGHTKESTCLQHNGKEAKYITSSEDRFHKSKHELNNNDATIYEEPVLQLRKASLEEALRREYIVHMTQDSQQSSTSIIPQELAREDVYGKREGSPFPTYDLLAARNSISMETSVSLLKVDEVDVDRRSTSPTPQQIDLILQQSNIDRKNFFPNNNTPVSERSTSPNKTNLEMHRKSQSECNRLDSVIKQNGSNSELVEKNCQKSPFEQLTIVGDDDRIESTSKFQIIDNTNEEEDACPDFDTSVLQRIDGVAAKPRTPSEERKLKLKKKRNSKSFQATHEVTRQTSGVDSDNEVVQLDANVLQRRTPSLEPMDSPPTSSSQLQEPFWVNRN